MSSVSTAVVLGVLIVCGTETATASNWTCGNPNGVELGQCTDGDRVGSKCSDCKCDVGYVYDREEEAKSANLRCTLKKYRNGTVTGRWKGKLLQRCQKARDCIVPNVVNLTSSGSVVRHGDRVNMECVRGHYLLYGARNALCNDGKFQPSLDGIVCYVVYCGYPRGSDWPQNGSITYSGSVHPVYKFGYDSRLQYRCNEGFKLVGRKYRRCLEDGNWAGKPPRCEAIPETYPTAAALEGSRRPFPTGANSSRRTQCRKGLVPVYRYTTWVCSKGRKWERFPATKLCVRRCDSPPEILLARLARNYKRESFGHGEKVVYKCRGKTTQLGGNSTRLCYDGIWQGTDIICRKPASRCKPYKLKNGRATPKEINPSHVKFRGGNVIAFDCFPGYKLEGSIEAYCKDSRWRFSGKKLPRCKRWSS